MRKVSLSVESNNDVEDHITLVLKDLTENIYVSATNDMKQLYTNLCNIETTGYKLSTWNWQCGSHIDYS